MAAADVAALLSSLTRLRDLAIFLLMLDGGLRLKGVHHWPSARQSSIGMTLDRPPVPARNGWWEAYLLPDPDRPAAAIDRSSEGSQKRTTTRYRAKMTAIPGSVAPARQAVPAVASSIVPPS